VFFSVGMKKKWNETTAANLIKAKKTVILRAQSSYP